MGSEEGSNYEVPHCGAFSTPHSHPSWAQILASGSFFQIPLAWIPPSMLETIIIILYLIVIRLLEGSCSCKSENFIARKCTKIDHESKLAVCETNMLRQ